MKLKVIFSFFTLSIIISSQLVAQSNNLGVMPIRIQIFDTENTMLMPIPPNPMFNATPVEEVEDHYLPIIANYLDKAFDSHNLTIKKLNLSDLSKENRQKEDNLYMLTIGEYYNVYRNPKANKKKKASTIEKGVRTGPIANIFADELDVNYLLFVSVVGCSIKEKVFQKKGSAFGKMNFFGWIMDANSGEIIEDVELQAKSNSLITNDKIKDLSETFAKQLQKKLAEISN